MYQKIIARVHCTTHNMEFV